MTRSRSSESDYLEPLRYKASGLHEVAIFDAPVRSVLRPLLMIVLANLSEIFDSGAQKLGLTGMRRARG